MKERVDFDKNGLHIKKQLISRERKDSKTVEQQVCLAMLTGQAVAMGNAGFHSTGAKCRAVAGRTSAS